MISSDLCKTRMERERGVETRDQGAADGFCFPLHIVPLQRGQVTGLCPWSHVLQNRACNVEDIASLLAHDRLSKQDGEPIRKNVRDQR